VPCQRSVGAGFAGRRHAVELVRGRARIMASRVEVRARQIDVVGLRAVSPLRVLPLRYPNHHRDCGPSKDGLTAVRAIVPPMLCGEIPAQHGPQHTSTVDIFRATDR